MKRHINAGLRKICSCPRRRWAACPHSWHVNYKARNTKTPDSTLPDGTLIKGETIKGKAYQFSLDRYANKHIDRKTDAEELAADIRKAIRSNTFGQTAPALDQLTVGQLLDTYFKRYVEIERKDSVENVAWQIAAIKRFEVERVDGRKQPLGEWRMADVTSDTIMRFKETRGARGIVAANRDLSFLAACFNWAIPAKYIKESPFKLGTATVVKLTKEKPRERRLRDGEEEAILSACDPFLHAIVIAAVDSGCRKGELLSLQWEQIEGLTVDDDGKTTWAPKARISLPAQKTKTKTARKVPISTRLRGVLEMRVLDPTGKQHAPTDYVFGSVVGTPVLGFGRAWRTVLLKSHGVTPEYIKTNLTPKCRLALREIGLHFHDLRRECGSRWMDGATPIATIQRWLGHSNVSQTSTYLAATDTSDDRQMERYEARLAAFKQLVTGAGSGDHNRSQSDQEAIDATNEIAVGLDPVVN